ncbi:MAG: hypothetical protein FD170_1783 [Bacteroidetes bacterium]|nr:MAG: hypothetical protein FD170_1783 [Bacteroidota bacterium]
MIKGKDSVFLSDRLPEFLSKIKSDIGNQYDVKFFVFGQNVVESDTADFSDGKTDISSLLSVVNSRYYNRNLGAMILLSDGIYNSGENPLYQVRNLTFPVFTVKFGDTTVNRDLIISKVNHNRYAYKGNQFPVEVLVHAREAAGESTRLVVTSEGEEIFSRNISVSSGNQVFTIPLLIEAKESGLKKYRIVVENISGEISLENNARDIFVEVKEMRQKIAVVANSPHPDLAALKRALEYSNNFEAEMFFVDNFTANIADYSLYVLHQLPSASNQSTRLMDELTRLKIPALFILGSQTDIPRLNRMQAGVSLVGHNNSSNEALPALNRNFPLFIITEQMENLFADLPPLVSPFGNYQISNATYSLAHQKIGQLKTELPLVAFAQTADVRYGFIAGEGIWKWRMHDFAANGNHYTFDDFVVKSVQYLSQQTEKGKFRVFWNNYYAENDPVEFSARLYNDSDQPITGPEVSIIITSEQGKEFNYSFSINDESYHLQIGSLPAGLYSFRAETDPGTGVLVKTGNFVVTSLILEDVNTVADHRLLDAIASETGGISFFQDEIDKISETIRNRDDIKPVVYSKRRYTDLVDFYPLLILLILMMGVEWFLRKYSGSY